LQVRRILVIKAGPEAIRALIHLTRQEQEKEGCMMYVTRHDHHRQHGPDFALHK